MSGDQEHRRGTNLHWTLAQYEGQMPEGDTKTESETDLNLPSEDFDEEIFDQMGIQDGFVDQSFREQPRAAIHENEGLRMCVVSGSVHNQGTSRVTTEVDIPDKLLSVKVDGATRRGTLKMKSNDNRDVVDPKEARAIEDLRGPGKAVLGTGKAESAVLLDKKGQHCAELTDYQNGITNLGVFKSPEKAARCYDVLERDPDDPKLNLPTKDYQNGTGPSGGSSSSTGNAGSEATSHRSSSAESDRSEANGDSSSSTESDGPEANGDSSSSTESDGPDVNIDSLDSLSPARNESEANNDNRLTSESNGPYVHIDNNPSSGSHESEARSDSTSSSTGRNGPEASPDRTDLDSD